MVSCVFFFKQKTAYEVRISDWSSDVCSSDLYSPCGECPTNGWEAALSACAFSVLCPLSQDCMPFIMKNIIKGQSRKNRNGELARIHPRAAGKIGRASCRERVCQYV